MSRLSAKTGQQVNNLAPGMNRLRLGHRRLTTAYPGFESRDQRVGGWRPFEGDWVGYQRPQPGWFTEITTANIAVMAM